MATTTFSGRMLSTNHIFEYVPQCIIALSLNLLVFSLSIVQPLCGYHLAGCLRASKMNEPADKKPSRLSSLFAWAKSSKHRTEPAMLPSTAQPTNSSRSSESTDVNGHNSIKSGRTRYSGQTKGSRRTKRSIWSRRTNKSSLAAADEPRRGNRASIGPSRSDTPDVIAFLTHIAGNGEPSDTPFVQTSTQAGGFRIVGDKTTYTPQYAHRNHGEVSMLDLHQPPEASPSAVIDGNIIILPETYDEFAWQQDVQQKSMSERRDSVGQAADVSQPPTNPQRTQE
jgi:hypothetical protein